jgi:four helix bundle protein
MRGDELATRLLEFAARVMKMMSAMPKTMAAKHIAGQLFRSSTSAGANYEEARAAESRSDFIHKLALVWKEIRESCYWLKLIHHAQVIKPILVEALLKESDELSRIMAKSLLTARKSKL